MHLIFNIGLQCVHISVCIGLLRRQRTFRRQQKWHLWEALYSEFLGGGARPPFQGSLVPGIQATRTHRSLTAAPAPPTNPWKQCWPGSHGDGDAAEVPGTLWPPHAAWGSSHTVPSTWGSSHTGFLPHGVPPTQDSSDSSTRVPPTWVLPTRVPPMQRDLHPLLLLQLGKHRQLRVSGGKGAIVLNKCNMKTQSAFQVCFHSRSPDLANESTACPLNPSVPNQQIPGGITIMSLAEFGAYSY